ncbi:hypothetical protein OBBRIDRAFT_145536 [Obba rivulosa]|uniref:Uncharacterized protein n=1 Tax=Obba rivulosa TaxID=1052685 RepID=A0A8E2DRM0_9APHY|nr:hypothetical protein OBBRIDRAFT_145536 [Obba rivulosa]
MSLTRGRPRGPGRHRILSQGRVLDHQALRYSRAKRISPKLCMYMFPSTEDSAVEASRDASKPVLSRLVAVSGNEHIVTDPSLQQSSLLFEPRARLESTTSSRFFPGGWFSSAPKSSDGGRTSLDHAAGEFSKSPASPTVSPAVEASVSSPTNSAAEQERKKWCTIM